MAKRKYSFPKSALSRYNFPMKTLSILLSYLLTAFISLQLYAAESEELQPTTSSWRIGDEVINITRDPIEHISINEDCHPLNEKNCDVQKALEKYLALTVNEETKALFEAAPDVRPGNIICQQLLGGTVLLGSKEKKGRFPTYEEFCRFPDNGLISLSSLAYYTGPEKVPDLPTREMPETDTSP